MRVNRTYIQSLLFSRFQANKEVNQIISDHGKCSQEKKIQSDEMKAAVREEKNFSSNLLGSVHGACELN